MEAPFIVIPVIVPVLDVFEFQFVISDDVIPAATEAENTGSVSVWTDVAPRAAPERIAARSEIESCLPFQLVISLEVIPDAALAVKIGSVSDSISPSSILSISSFVYVSLVGVSIVDTSSVTTYLESLYCLNCLTPAESKNCIVCKFII